jgi:hypothetical protein
VPAGFGVFHEENDEPDREEFYEPFSDSTFWTSAPIALPLDPGTAQIWIWSPEDSEGDFTRAPALGASLDATLHELGEVAEGVKNHPLRARLARREEGELPISEGVYLLLFEGVSPRDAVYELLGRRLKAED